MIVPKRRVVFYFVVVTTMAWIYLASYYMFSGNIETSEKYLVLKSDLNSPQDDMRLAFASYDKTPDRNPDKPGEQGGGVTLNFLEKRQEGEGYKEHAFNRVASDKISVQRNLLDYRNSK